MPLNDGTQSETRAVLDCHRANGSCEFNVGADRKTGGDVLDRYDGDGKLMDGFSEANKEVELIFGDQSFA